MTRFAHLCLDRMSKLTKQLVVTLGPSTGDLKGRCGLHSGPITAGVLRGEKARFQLFGDTVNTASRMESSGVPNRIHVSKETAGLLVSAGKEHWVRPRKDEVTLKGKGTLQTYWASPLFRARPRKPGSIASSSSLMSVMTTPEINGLPNDEYDLDFANGSEHNDDRKNINSKQTLVRLVDYNVEVLHALLVNVVLAREASTVQAKSIGAQRIRKDDTTTEKISVSEISPRSSLSTDEMCDVIDLPRFRGAKLHGESSKSPQSLSPKVKEQLRDFVLMIARLYRDVPFHNFDHATHVIMSANKLMKRIVTPDGVDLNQKEHELSRCVHEMTYGISSDHLMQFSVVFAALIHDVDHTGLTNKELVDIDAAVASTYNGKSVAEQNSIDMAWALLEKPEFEELRHCIFSTKSERSRFRQLIVKAVLATDIADKELQARRKIRWEQAFHANSNLLTNTKEDADRKATIVFEYIIQASDVSHCMQHWLTYQKFNSRLFEERYVAWLDGVAGEKDPSATWFRGEIWFFDNYIIPLAEKLAECGVFGVSYYEYLNYAQANRMEWERKGHEIVQKMLETCQQKYKNLSMRDRKRELKQQG
jgi:hypothetical protein